MGHLNAKLIISALESKQRAFREPQLVYISVTFLFTSITHFQDRHTRLYGVFWRTTDKPSTKAELALHS